MQFKSALLLLSVAIFIIVASVVATATNGTSQDAAWNFAGPGSAVGVQPAGMPVSSAANSVAKTNGAWLLATVNGGVWRTTDDLNTVSRPHWVSVFDSESVTCSSMTDLHVSSSNNNRVYAACGVSTSSQQGYNHMVANTGDLTGFAISNDAGVTWKMAAGFPVGYSITKILELPSGEVLVAVRGQYTDQIQGGIWRCPSYKSIHDSNSWKRIYSSTPMFDIVYDTVTDIVYASAAACTQAYCLVASPDRGITWYANTTNLKFTSMMYQPHVAKLAIQPGKALFLLTMIAPRDYITRGLLSGNGQLNYLNLTDLRSNKNSPWLIVGGTPMTPAVLNKAKNCDYECAGCKEPGDMCGSIDDDWKTADRCAITTDPSDDGIVYVTGNANFLAYRVHWKNGLGKAPCTVADPNAGACRNTDVDAYIWTPMTNLGGKWRRDTKDDHTPHVDTRHVVIDPASGNLLCTSDGGVSIRFKPKSAGQGYWRGISGDIGTFEYINFDYSAKHDRLVAGAQDNDVQFTEMGISAGGAITHKPAGAFGLGCDGTVGLVDDKNERMYGACQSSFGLSYLPLTTSTAYKSSQPLQTIDWAKRGFPATSSSDRRTIMSVFPFFQLDVKLNRANPLMINVWANISVYGSTDGPGIFELDVTNADASKGPNATLKMKTDGENVQVFEVGGIINGVNILRGDVVVAASNKHLFVQTGAASTRTKVAFPVEFAQPVSPIYTESYCKLGVVEPCTYTAQSWPNHARTMSLAVNPNDASTSVVSGWPSVVNNVGTEHIYYTTNKGFKWVDIFGNLRQVSGLIVSHVRPMGLCFVGNDKLVVGTVNGIFVTSLAKGVSTSQKWYRLGSRSQFPMVKVSEIKYYPAVDKLITGTFGRAFYMLKNANSTVTAASTGSNPYSAPSSSNNGDNKKKAIEIAVPIAVVAAAIIVFLVWKKKSTSEGTGYSAPINEQAAASSAYQQASV